MGFAQSCLKDDLFECGLELSKDQNQNIDHKSSERVQNKRKHGDDKGTWDHELIMLDFNEGASEVLDNNTISYITHFINTRRPASDAFPRVHKGTFTTTNAHDGGSPTDWEQEFTAHSFDQFIMELEEKNHEQRLNHTFGSFQFENLDKVEEAEEAFELEEEEFYQY